MFGRRLLHWLAMASLVLGCATAARPPVSARDASGRTVPADQIRYVVDGATLLVRPSKLGTHSQVLPASLEGRKRATNQNPWDLFDPVTKGFVAQYEGIDGFYLWSVGTDGPKRVEIDRMESEPTFRSPFVHGVLSADGSLLFLSGSRQAFVAVRTGKDLAFSALKPLGQGVQLVHDISWDGTRVVVSGHRPAKWDDPTNVVAPRMASVFEVRSDGALGRDLTAEYGPLSSVFVQGPHFMADSRSLLYEGDDDIDTGDRLFVVSPGQGERQLSPEAVMDRDFNTPCVLPDDRVVFFESADPGYLIRMYDERSGSTVTVDERWYSFTGYVRCR